MKRNWASSQQRREDESGNDNMSSNQYIPPPPLPPPQYSDNSRRMYAPREEGFIQHYQPHQQVPPQHQERQHYFPQNLYPPVVDTPSYNPSSYPSHRDRTIAEEPRYHHSTPNISNRNESIFHGYSHQMHPPLNQFHETPPQNMSYTQHQNIQHREHSLEMNKEREPVLARFIPQQRNSSMASQYYMKEQKRARLREEEQDKKNPGIDEITTVVSTTDDEVTSKSNAYSDSEINANMKTPTVMCRCVKSRCLKLYCDCFQEGVLCNADFCKCRSCLNTKFELGPNGRLHRAKKDYLLRKPHAFRKKPKEPGSGCACKNNRCLKKYCECFRNQLPCSAKCSCHNCGNLGLRDSRLNRTPVTRPQKGSSLFHTELKAGTSSFPVLDQRPADSIALCLPTSKHDDPSFATFEKVVNRTTLPPTEQNEENPSLTIIDSQTIGNTPEKVGDTSTEPKITPDFHVVKGPEDESSPT